MYYDDDDRMKELIESRMEAEKVEKEKERVEDKVVVTKAKGTKGKVAMVLGASVLALGSFGLGGVVFSSSGNVNGGQGLEESVSVAKENTATDQAVPTATKKTGTALSVAEVAKLTADSVVEIRTEVVSTGMRMQQYISEGAGSGVAISSDGYIVTNNHVIDGANKITVRLKNGESYEATLIGTDSQTDLAVIKVEGVVLSPATFGDSDALEVGEDAIAIGNPLGELGGTVTNGIISALDREITLDGKTMNLLQTNAAINPGNSGGGLFNNRGELVGVVVAKSAGSDVEGLGFAIPSNDVKAVVEQLKTHGYVQGRPVLGVSVVSVDSLQSAMQYGVNQLGVYVAELTEGTKSEASGLKVGDCIIAINDQRVSSTSDISTILQANKVGDTVKLMVAREGQMLNLDLELSEYKPASN